MFLGLDISTSCTGYAILNADGTIRKLGSFDLKNPNKFPNMFSKARFIREELKEMSYHHKIELIYIEPALSMFQMGKSSALTISTLLKFNGIISWICEDEFKITPQFIPAISARKICGIKVPKGIKAKQEVIKFLIGTIPEFAKIVEYTKQGNIVPKFYDMADALVIAKAGYLQYGKS